jgi:hypothetical protein
MNLLKQSEIGAAISAVAAAARANQTAIHEIAVSTLDHTREFGDFTGCERLLNALPNGQRVKSLAQWFNVMSGKQLTITLDPKTKVWSGKLQRSANSEADFDIAKAMEVDYGSFQPEIVQSVITLKTLLQKVTKIATDTETVTIDGKTVPRVSAEVQAIAAQTVAYMRTLPAVQALKVA